MKITRRTFAAGAASASGLVAMPYVAKAQQSINVTIASSHPVAVMWPYQLKNTFQPEVDKILAAGGGKYKINWKEAYGGTLYKFQDTMEAVRDGITDVGFVGTLWEGDTMPLCNVSYFTPFATSDHKLQIATFDKLMETPKLKEEWNKNGMVHLASYVTDTYDLYTSFPIKSMDDLKGRKINAPGTAANWLQGTGAIPVDGALTTYYTNIQTGVTEGALTFAVGVMPIRLYEVAKHLTRVNIGSMYVGGVGANKQFLEKLPKDVQDAFRKAGNAVSKNHGDDISARMGAAIDTMVKQHGVKVADLPPAEREKWIKGLPNIVKIWSDKNGPAAKEVLGSYFSTLRAAGIKPGRDWDKEA